MLFWVRQYSNIFEIYAYGCNLVYDVSNRDTFDALNTWWNEVNTYCSSPDVVKMIVGNKVDKVILVRIKKKSLAISLHKLRILQESSRVVTYEEGANFARKLSTLFVECSAKTKVGVKQAFEELVEKVC